ncbi:MAG: methionyl aminopeptidase [Chlamydiia bacterium]|nr:methionyl aminopeptidase [Chlamydiia bacterium]
MISRNDPCWCGSGKKWKKCHHPFLPPKNFESQKDAYFKNYQIILKTPEQIEGIRAASKLAATILKEVCALAKEGITTQALDDLSTKLHKEAGATPAALGYGHPPFPKGICTSLNEVICHGIPNDTPLVNGDILNIDVTSILNGYYGDCSAMVCIGEITEEKQKVVDVSYECLMRAIKILKPGVMVSEIGQVIEDYATSEGCSVVNQFVAHGVGTEFHEAPQIPHCYNHTNIPLTAGMTFTIEPMINAGVRSGVIDSKDKWTARTTDGKPSAQWEHTLLITEDSYEILTLP